MKPTQEMPSFPGDLPRHTDTGTPSFKRLPRPGRLSTEETLITWSLRLFRKPKLKRPAGQLRQRTAQFAATPTQAQGVGDKTLLKLQESEQLGSQNSKFLIWYYLVKTFYKKPNSNKIKIKFSLDLGTPVSPALRRLM